MNSDCFYTIGNSHTFCEDYSLSNQETVVLGDGCSSSSEYVNVGARILSHTAANFNIHTENFASDIGRKIIEGTYDIASKILPMDSLDCALLIASVKENKVRILMFGDGVCVVRKKEATYVYHVEYESGAPYYLSYLLDCQRYKDYKTQFGDKKVFFTQIEISDSADSKAQVIEHCGFNYRPDLLFDVEEGDVISIISDGINSFTKEDSTEIPWIQLVDEFTKYKNTTGDFVKRRMNFFNRYCNKEKIFHFDDISCASICI